MKRLQIAIAAIALLAGVALAAPADAHGYRYRGYGGYWYGPGVHFYYGGPYWWGPRYYAYPYSYYPYAYYPPPSYSYTVPSSPPVYIERGDDNQPQSTAPAEPSGPASGAQWWYFCNSPRGAYPYVRECPGGWEKVPAVPPGQAR